MASCWCSTRSSTGFRIAWGGAQEKYGVVPDLACYGKAVSGGFPLAAIAGRGDVMGVLDARSRPREQVVWATHTLNGNPVCAVAGVRPSMCLLRRASTTIWRG